MTQQEIVELLAEPMAQIQAAGVPCLFWAKAADGYTILISPALADLGKSVQATSAPPKESSDDPPQLYRP